VANIVFTIKFAFLLILPLHSALQRLLAVPVQQLHLFVALLSSCSLETLNYITQSSLSSRTSGEPV
jgi:hypothetical protein